ncbi:two-component system, chemotaxis family, response regulator CheY [Maridesulfovibrio ferrireducens]|uniref:Two-component system, chemotaxis family, response regulator CheY n=1 Tax=Maridesulfovibrio ferrireducens TaxID=246191 RepID=A0A1G9JCL0_9BACT|nr:response regulator [Maridesulfovibrio ferrireducens]SDL34946.1 two-component system, chemotaxis family, response regulator CheY [Maridesulfovibrio ferrireducens]
MRALVAEDEFVSRKLISTFLSPLFEIDIAVNGKEAFEAYKMAFEEGKPYTLICMDIMMPEMDGITALEAIRNFEKENGTPNKMSVKVFMTTALNDPKTVIRSFHDVEASAFLVKPVSKEKLYEELEKLGVLHK